MGGTASFELTRPDKPLTFAVWLAIRRSRRKQLKRNLHRSQSRSPSPKRNRMTSLICWASARVRPPPLCAVLACTQDARTHDARMQECTHTTALAFAIAPAPPRL